MSNFFIDKICTYLRQGEIKVRFSTTGCIEKDIHTMIVYGKNDDVLGIFKITKGDMEVINLVAKVENLENVL